MELRRMIPTGPIARGLLLALAVLCLAPAAEAAKGKSKKFSPQQRQRSSQGNSNSNDSFNNSSRSFSSSGATTMSMEIIPVGGAGVTSGTTVTHGLAPSAPNPPGSDTVRPSREIPLADLNTTIVLSLNNVPMDQLMRFMAETTGKTVMKQKDLNTNVTVNAPRPISKRQALELIYASLQLDSIYVAEQDELIQLINFKSLGNIRLDSIPASVDVQTLADSLRIVRKIYKFDGMNPDDSRRHLELYMPNTNFSIDNRSNTLVITDQLTRIKAYDKIIQAMIQPPDDRVIEIYKLTKANANDLCQLLRTFINNNALIETTETLAAIAGTSATLASTTATLTHAPGSDVVLRNSRGGGGIDITLIPESRSNWIIALVPRAQKAGLDRLISEFDFGQTDDRVIEIYKLQNIDAPQLISMLSNIIANKGLTASTSSGGSQAAMGSNGKPAHDHPPRGMSNKMFQRMAESMASSGSKIASSGDVVFLPESRQNWIIAIMRPDLKPQLDELVKQFDIPRNPDVQLRMIDLAGGNASALASTLSRLIGDMPMSGPLDYIRLVPSEDNARLMVMSSEANYKKIQDLIKTIGTVPNDRTLEIYPVKNTDASQLVVLINAIISNKGLGKLPEVNVGAPNTGVHGSAYFKRMAESRGEGYDKKPSSIRADQVSDVTLMPETRLNWIIAIMRPEVKADLEALLTQFDVAKARLVQPHNIEVAPGTAYASYSALYRVFSELANNNTAADFVRLYPLDDGNHILAFCSEENLKSIQDVLKTIGNAASQDRAIEVFQVQNTDAYSLATLIARVLPIKGRTVNLGPGAYDVSLAYDQRLNWIIAIMKPEAKADVVEAIKQFDVPKVQQVKAHRVPVDPGTASSTYYSLYNVYSNLFTNSAPGDFARFYPGEDGNSVLVFCTDENLPRIQELIKTIGAAPTDRVVQIYTILNGDAYTVVNLISQTLPIKGKSVKVNSPGGDVTFTYDYRLNWIVAVMKPEMKKEIDELVKQFDVPKTRELQVRTLDLKGGNAAFMSATLTRILSEQPASTIRDIIRVMPTEDNSKLIVLSTEANYKTVQDLIDTIGIVPNNRVFEIYQITNADAGSVISMIYSIVTSRNLGSVSGSSAQVSPTNYSSYRSYSRHLADAMATGGGQTVDLTLLPDMRLNWIIAVMKPELKTEIDALVKKFDIPTTREVQLRSIDLKGGNATNLAATLTRLIAGMPLDDPRDYVRIAPSDDNAKLLVMSSEANYTMVQDLINTVGVTPSNRLVEIYKLKNADPTQIMTMVQSIITNRGLGTTSSAGAGVSPSSYSSPRSYYRHMNESMAAAGGGASTSDLMMIPDARLKWIVTIMKPELKKEVDALILQFDQAKEQLVQPRVLDLAGGNATTLAGTLNQLVADMPVDAPEDAIRILPTADNSRLLVVSSEANYKVIQDFAKTIGTVTNNLIIENYKLTYADPSAIISMVNSIISSRGLGTTSVGTGALPSMSSYRGGGGGGFSRSDFFRRMSQSMSSSSSGAAAGQSADLLLIPETRLRWIVAIMKPSLKPEVDALVKQFDIQRASTVQTHIIDLKGGNASRMSSTLDRLINDYIENFLDSNDPNNYVRVLASDDNARLIVMCNDENFKMVENMVASIGTVDSNRVLEVYRLTYAQASSIITLVQSVITNKGLASAGAAAGGVSSGSPMMMGGNQGGGQGGNHDHGDNGGRRSFYNRSGGSSGFSSTGSTGAQNVDLLMMPESRLNWVIAIMKPELKAEVDGLIKQFDVEKTRQITARTLDLKNGNGTSLAGTITSLLGDLTASGDPNDFIRITPSQDNSHLIVMSTEANYKVVQDLAAMIVAIPNNRVVETYKLTYAEASQIATTINSIITNKGVGSTSVAAGTPATPSSLYRRSSDGGGSGGSDSEGRSSFLRRMMSTMSAGTAQSSDLMLIPDTRLNWLVAIMKPELKVEVDALVKQFDIDLSKDITARTIELKRSTPVTMAQMITGLIQDKMANSGNPRDIIRVTPHDDGLRLVVMSSEANFKMVQDLVTTIDEVPDDRVVDIYKLTNADASELITLLNNIISKSPMSRGSSSTLPVGSLSGSSSMGGGSMSRSSRFLGGMSSSGSSGRSGFSSRFGSSFPSFSSSAGAVQVGNVMLIPETRLNWIITICPKDQKAELDALVKQFDIQTPDDFQMRVAEVLHVDANDVAQNLNSMLQQQMTGGRRDLVRVSATDDGQRLLVWSTESKFTDIKEMIKTLDVDIPKDVQARTIEIKYAEAVNLATTLNNIFRDSFFMGGGGQGKREFVRVSATEDGNRLMIMSSESNYKIIQDMIKQLDTVDSESQVTKVFKIEHLEAQALADQLNTLFQERSRTQSSSMFGFFGYSGGGRSSSGTIPVPSIVPSPRTNTIMVMVRPKDLTFIEDMVKELDVPIDAENFEPRIYRIQNTDANEVVTVLQSLFQGGASSGARQTTNINYYLDAWRPNRNTGTQDSITAIFGKLQFVVDRVTNTIVVLASNTKNYEIIDKVIAKLDQPDPENSEVMVFTLKYADSLKLADQLNYLFSEGTVQRPNSTNQTQQRTTQNNANDPNGTIGGDDTPNTLDEEIVRDFVPLWGSNPNSRAGETERPINSMIGKVRVVPDIRSNKLTVAAPPVFLPTLKGLIESLDHPEPQVYITTRIVELTRGTERRIGLRWTPDPKTIDPAELDNAILGLGQLGFLDAFGGSGGVPTGFAAKTTIPAVGGGNIGGLDLSKTLQSGNSVLNANVNIALLVQLLVKNSQSRLYTQPGVTVNNNETGNIFFGSEYPFRSNVNVSYNGNQNIAVRYRPVGINLDIRPHINGMDEIVLKVAGENSSVRPELIDGAIIKDTRQFTTEVSLKNGETMVIGGILIDDGQKTKRGLPILGSIPVLKYVFGKDDSERNLRELVFFVTPEVLVNSQDTRRIVDNTTTEMNAIEQVDHRKLDQIRPFQDIPDLNASPLPNRIPRLIQPNALPEVLDERPPAVPRGSLVNPSMRGLTPEGATQDDQPLDKPRKLGSGKVITGKTPDKPVAEVPDEERTVVMAKKDQVAKEDPVIVGKVVRENPPD